jgi:hypothetical protein
MAMSRQIPRAGLRKTKVPFGLLEEAARELQALANA